MMLCRIMRPRNADPLARASANVVGSGSVRPEAIADGNHPARPEIASVTIAATSGRIVSRGVV